jgi:hypothetical protein
MPALQTHYTSARMGQSGHAGFGFHGISAGIDQADLQQIGPLGELTLPRDLDLGAPQSELAARAPVLLRYRVLGSGRWVLIRSRYVGTDYSGRSGNFFAHALIGSPEALRHWPVDYCGWPHWQERLERDDGAPPPTLDAVDLERIEPPAELAPEALARFLGADRGRTELLTAMIRAALARAETDRAMLIRDPGDQGRTWIACVQKAFPRQAALTLSFCTYQYDGYEAEAINVSVGETNFRFDDADFGYRYFAFDLIDGRASEVPAAADEYAPVVAEWMTRAPARLAAFHRFAEGFDLPAADASVLQVLRLFRLDLDEIPLPTGADLEALLDFARDRTRPALRDRMLVLLADRLGAAADLSASEYRAMIGFLARTAGVTGDPAHRARAIAAWLQMFDRLLVGRGTALKEVGAAKAVLLRLDAGAAPGLAEALVAEDHLDALFPAVREAAPAVLLAVVEEIVRQLAVADAGRAWPNGRAAGYLAGLVCAVREPEPVLDLLLAAVASAPADLAAACRRLAAELREERPDQAEARLEAVGRRLARLGTAARMVRERLDGPDTHAILRGDWLERLDGSDDPAALLAGYRQDDLARTPAFAKAADAWLRGSCFERLPDEAAAAQARRWLLNGELERLQPAAMQRAATLINARLPLRSKDAEHLAVAEPLAALAARRGLALTPNRALILTTAARVAAGEKLDWAVLPNQLAGHLGGLSNKEYRGLLEGLLPAALSGCHDYKAHGQRFAALCVADKRETLLKVYRTLLVYQLEDPATLRQAVKHWLVDAMRQPDGEIDPDIADILAAALAHLKSDQRSDLAKKLGTDASLPAEAKTALNALLAAADGKRSPLAKLGGTLGRLFRAMPGN